jgi:hypothetical protein
VTGSHGVCGDREQDGDAADREPSQDDGYFAPSAKGIRAILQPSSAPATSSVLGEIPAPIPARYRRALAAP